jgi:HNH endonuclease
MKLGKLDRAFLKSYKKDKFFDQKKCCAYCFEPLTLNSGTIEHIIPISKGGNHLKNNIKVSCSHCNFVKDNLSINDFVNKIKNSNDLNFIKIRIRKTIWIATHKSCKRIMQYVGQSYNGPDKNMMKKNVL